MDDTQLSDLKQFILATVSQATADMATKDDIKDLREDIAKVDQKIDEVQAVIADSVTLTNDEIDEKINDHDRRISQLEKRTV